MANITQTINSLNGGISQQPDEQKIPGQVNDLNNAIPHVVEGLVKRPSGKFVASLSDGTLNSSTNGKWFHYYRDENEQYIGQIFQNGTLRMWDCLTGAEKTVVNAIGNTTYLTHTGDEDIQTLTLNDFTYINNRSITTEMDTTEEPDTNFKKEIFVELKSVAYAKQYSLNVFDNTTPSAVTTATRIKVDRILSSNNYCSNVDQDTDANSVKDGFMHDHAGRINSSNTFVANKAKTFDEEKKVANKAPVDSISIQNISIEKDNNSKVEKVKNTKFEFIIKFADLFFEESAITLKKRLEDEYNLKDINIKKMSKNLYRVYKGPFYNLGSIKNVYNEIADINFENIELIKL